jgi:hypothetical protein
MARAASPSPGSPRESHPPALHRSTQPEPISAVDVELRWYRTNGESRAMASSTMAVDRCWPAVHPRPDANGTLADGELLFVRLLSRDGMGDGLPQQGGCLPPGCVIVCHISGEHERIAERACRYDRGTEGSPVTSSAWGGGQSPAFSARRPHRPVPAGSPRAAPQARFITGDYAAAGEAGASALDKPFDGADGDLFG